MSKCYHTLAAFLGGFSNFSYPVPVLLGIAAFALAVFIGIESKQDGVVVNLGGIGQLKLLKSLIGAEAVVHSEHFLTLCTGDFCFHIARVTACHTVVLIVVR